MNFLRKFKRRLVEFKNIWFFFWSRLKNGEFQPYSSVRKPNYFAISDEKLVRSRLKNGKFSKVRNRNMAATLVLKLESEGVFESDLRSVWIFELGQKLTEIATFYIIFLRKGFLNEEKLVISILSYRSVNVKKEKRKGKEFSWKRLICKGNKWTGLFFQ